MKSQPQESAAKVALIIIDMMNDLEFEGGEELYENALPAARQIAALKKAHKSQVPANANDLRGGDQSGRRKTRARLHAAGVECAGRGIGFDRLQRVQVRKRLTP